MLVWILLKVIDKGEIFYEFTKLREIFKDVHLNFLNDLKLIQFY